VHHDGANSTPLISKHSWTLGVDGVRLSFIGLRRVYRGVCSGIDDKLRTDFSNHTADTVWIEQIKFVAIRCDHLPKCRQETMKFGANLASLSH
jgi:hypothetical protein